METAQTSRVPRRTNGSRVAPAMAKEGERLLEPLRKNKDKCNSSVTSYGNLRERMNAKDTAKRSFMARPSGCPDMPLSPAD